MAIETISQLFAHNVTSFNRPDLLVYRGRDGSFYNISTNEFKDRVIHLALGLRELGLKAGAKVIILAENRPEWHIFDFACHLLGGVVVPVYPTLIAGQIEYIVNNSESVLIALSNETQAAKIHEIRDKIKKVKNVVAMDAEAAKEGVLSYESLLETGREQNSASFYPAAVDCAEPQEVATIIYTSGTTGVPKGVELSHRNLISNIKGASECLEFSSEDRGLSFLPLSHAFEKTVDYIYFYQGASIVYSVGIENVAQDLEESSPTLMAAVPRFYEKIKAKIEARVEEDGGLKKAIFNWALKVGYKKNNAELSGRRVGLLLSMQLSLANMLVFEKIRQKTGGKLRYFISGGAPLSMEVANFFAAVGLYILEGYGLTETAPIMTTNTPGRPKFGTVGRALPDVEITIADDGEVITRGPNVMMGYYKMPEETRAVLTEDGWFSTGDIGVLDDEGYLAITDRKKQLIVTSGGKKVAPQPIEKEIENCKPIEQVVLIGDKRKFISALIVPDFVVLRQFAQTNGLQAATNEELITDPAVVELIQTQVDERQEQFSSYERIRKFILLPEAFSIEKGQLTPTMKVKRRVVLEENAEQIEDMYA